MNKLIVLFVVTAIGSQAGAIDFTRRQTLWGGLASMFSRVPKLSLEAQIPAPVAAIEIDPTLIAYRLDQGQNHRALFMAAYNIVTQNEPKAGYDSRVAEKLIDTWFAANHERLGWIEAEVAKELSIPQAELFDTIDYILNPERLVMAFLKPQRHLGSVEHYHQKVIDTYIHKVASLSPEFAQYLQRLNSASSPAWNNGLNQEIRRTLGIAGGPKILDDHIFPLQYDIQVPVEGKYKSSIRSLLQQGTLTSENLSHVAKGYAEAIDLVQQSIQRLSRVKESKLQREVLRLLHQNSEDLRNEMAHFPQRFRETVAQYQAYYRMTIKRQREYGHLNPQMNQIYQELDKSLSLIPEPDQWLRLLSFNGINLDSLEQYFHKEELLVVEESCEPMLLPAPNESPIGFAPEVVKSVPESVPDL